VELSVSKAAALASIATQQEVCLSS